VTLKEYLEKKGCQISFEAARGIIPASTFPGEHIPENSYS
jgi:hypothetical protein